MIFFLIVIIQIIIAFIGFAIGRFSDKYGGYLEKIWIIPVPHHWIWGVLLIIIGIFFRSSFWGISCISFGIGHFISDLNDFLHMRFFGEEPPHEWSFWNID